MTMLSGKTALLTGALGTLGRAQAVALAKAGSKLLLLDRPGAEGGEAFAAGIAGAQKTDCSYVGEDLNDLAAAEIRVRDLARARGGIDILNSKNGRRDTVTTGDNKRKNKVIADKKDKVIWGWGLAAY